MGDDKDTPATPQSTNPDAAPNREALVDFSMSPMDKGASVSRYVARSLDIIDKSGLPYRMGPMSTCVEGSLRECLDVVERCFERMKDDCDRITMTLKMDYRKGRSGRLRSKIRSVEQKLGRSVDKGE
jgi:uncharacterized protein (TIGR00106 family)